MFSRSFDRLHVSPLFSPVTCFPALFTGYTFPALFAGYKFPALFTGYMFSRSFDWLHVFPLFFPGTRFFPLFLPVVCFPALATRDTFFLSCHWSHFPDRLESINQTRNLLKYFLSFTWYVSYRCRFELFTS